MKMFECIPELISFLAKVILGGKTFHNKKGDFYNTGFYYSYALIVKKLFPPRRCQEEEEEEEESLSVRKLYPPCSFSVSSSEVIELFHCSSRCKQGCQIFTGP
jgi:hypothetical protein